jgi:hypothetical protein
MPVIVYDFLQHIYEAVWFGEDPNYNQTYQLPIGGEGTTAGYIRYDITSLLEDKSQPSAFLVHPTWAQNGSVRGEYYGVSFEEGDILVALFGFIDDTKTDGATFSIGCISKVSNIISNSNFYSKLAPSNVYFQTFDTRDGYLVKEVVTLNDNNCKNFYLRVDAGDYAEGDWAVWVTAYIERP